MSLPIYHTANQSYAVSGGVAALAAEQEGWLGEIAISPARVVRLFCSSLLPATDDSPDFELTLPVAGRLPDIIGFGAGMASHYLFGNSFAGKLVTVLATCCSSLQMANAMPDIIDIPDARTMAKIGRDPSFPVDGHYRQTGNINARELWPVGSGYQPFTGRFDGNGKVIDKVSRCLFERLSGDGTVSNLHIRNVDINYSGDVQELGVIACSMTENSRIRHALVEKCSISVRGEERHPRAQPGSGLNVAVGCGLMEKNSRIEYLNLIDGHINTYGGVVAVGAGAGEMEGNATIDQLRATSFNIITDDILTYAGMGAGRAVGDTSVKGTTAIRCNMFSFSETSFAAIGVGQAHDNARIENTLSLSSVNFAHALRSPFEVPPSRPCPCPCANVAAGVGATYGHALALNTTAIDSRFLAQVAPGCGDAFAAIGIGDATGMSYAKNTEAVGCLVSAAGGIMDAAIGQVITTSQRAPEGTMAISTGLQAHSNVKPAGVGTAAIDAVVQFGRPAKRIDGGISCGNNWRNDRDGYYLYPDSCQCKDICWSSIDNVSSNASGIYFDRSCQFSTPNDTFFANKVMPGGVALLGTLVALGAATGYLYYKYRQARPEGEPTAVIDRLICRCEGCLGIAPPVRQPGADAARPDLCAAQDRVMPS